MVSRLFFSLSWIFRGVCFFFVLAFLSSCGTAVRSVPDRLLFSFSIDKSYPAKYFNERVRFLVMHYTAVDFEKSLKILTEKRVSSHYLIPDTPVHGRHEIFLLLKEDLRAWHAGVSYWQNRTNLNDTSIGIEVVNLGYEDLSSGRRWFSFTDYQIQIIAELAKDIIKRYGINPTAVVGHSDIAPGRKVDPGPLFPWKKLAEQGVGAWYNEVRVQQLKNSLQGQKIDIRSLQQDLKKYGYQIEETGEIDEQTKVVVRAFQMHFRQSDFSGDPDAETVAILKNLIEKYRSS
ncbi:MAG: N-acetylmuramoyl-L-alanine amidase [Flavobacteriales bacterium AspAUS03]